MKVRILTKEEWYPVIVLAGTESWASEIEASEEEVQRWKAAFDAFDEVQEEIADRFRAQNDAGRS